MLDEIDHWWPTVTFYEPHTIKKYINMNIFNKIFGINLQEMFKFYIHG